VSWKVRNAAVMVRGGLERATEGNRRLVAERPADQLQSDRHAVPRLSGRNCEHREPEIVDGSHEARDCLDGGLGARAAYIGLFDGRRRSARSRRDDDVDVLDRREMSCERGPRQRNASRYSTALYASPFCSRLRTCTP
jgi:hypothetical protein